MDTRLYEHTVWCKGDHDQFTKECLIEVKIDEDLVVSLIGAPGDQRIAFDGCITSTDHIDEAINAVTSMRAQMVNQSQAEDGLDWDAYEAAQQVDDDSDVAEA